MTTDDLARQAMEELNEATRHLKRSRELLKLAEEKEKEQSFSR